MLTLIWSAWVSSTLLAGGMIMMSCLVCLPRRMEVICVDVLHWTFRGQLHHAIGMIGLVFLLMIGAKLESLSANGLDWKARELRLSAQRDGVITLFTLLIYYLSIQLLKSKKLLVAATAPMQLKGTLHPQETKDLST
ncbi:Aste57867_18793 [Aphanomyces stellatus]|uniref:Aste57867_18793 protein n=1 Tax=Aphanomyces stellatus TaxID=120398 RepID=A0A485LCH7_9STRA|nr:hypothetical protein As57867_018729 [Aphanomyces stellatus]VFT95527.1 Aste57867_18793 [Aphanomyces stellatus]